MKKFSFFNSIAFAIAVIGFTACERTNDGGGISSSLGYIKVYNVCEYPFKIYIDGNYKATVNGGSNGKYAVNSGIRTLKIEQKSGYYQYPLIQEESVYCSEGAEKTFNIPSVTTGKIKVVNNETDPYTIKINGETKGTINAGSTKTFTVDAWHEYKVYCIQNSGYYFYPSEQTNTVKVDAGYIYTIAIND